MAENSKQGCILCGENPSEGMHLSGQKLLEGKRYTYMLCKKCCLHNQEYGEGGVNRKKLWSLVEKKICKANIP